MDFDDNASEMMISGVVMAVEWDDDDDVTEIEISTDDDNYYVEKNALWEELVDFCDTQVEVTGIVTEEKDGTKQVLVTSYETLDDIDYDEEEIEYDDVYEEWRFESEEEEDEARYP
ncbi:MAG: hypothetical protein LJE96_13095 [Deltaproteobacteria bacterium]|jgi:hypothetical protein|nr:hypothetical protein [Deltaproteobacteria bacterium]